MVWHKKFGPAQNNLGPVKRQGISKRHNHKDECANFCGLLRKAELYVPFQVSTKLMHCLHYLCGFLDFRGPFSFRAYLSHFQEPCKDYLKRVRATNWGLLSPVLSIFYPYIYERTIQISKKENHFAIIFTKFSSCKLHRSKRIPTEHFSITI